MDVSFFVCDIFTVSIGKQMWNLKWFIYSFWLLNLLNREAAQMTWLFGLKLVEEVKEVSEEKNYCSQIWLVYLSMLAKAKHKLFSIRNCFVQCIPYVTFSKMASFTKQMFFEHPLYPKTFFKPLKMVQVRIRGEFCFQGD